MQEVVPSVYTFDRLPAGRVYLLEGDDGFTLIDASVKPAGRSILRQLKAAGINERDVQRILITHAHPDHVGALPLLSKRTGAQVLLSKIEREVLEGHKPVPQPPIEDLRGLARFLRPPTTTFKMKADGNLEDGEILGGVLGGLKMVSSPGHATGHLAFFQPDRRILFCGDVIFNFRRMTLPWSFFTVDMAENKRSIQKLADLEPEVVCFGHGKPIVRDAAAKLRAFAASVTGSQIS